MNTFTEHEDGCIFIFDDHTRGSSRQGRFLQPRRRGARRPPEHRFVQSGPEKYSLIQIDVAKVGVVLTDFVQDGDKWSVSASPRLSGKPGTTWSRQQDAIIDYIPWHEEAVTIRFLATNERTGETVSQNITFRIRAKGDDIPPLKVMSMEQRTIAMPGLGGLSLIAFKAPTETVSKILASAPQIPTRQDLHSKRIIIDTLAFVLTTSNTTIADIELEFRLMRMHHFDMFRIFDIERLDKESRARSVLASFMASKIYHQYEFAIAGSPQLDLNTLSEFVRTKTPKVVLLAPFAYGSYHAANYIGANEPIVALTAAAAGGMSLLVLAASLSGAKWLLERVGIDIMAADLAPKAEETLMSRRPITPLKSSQSQRYPTPSPKPNQTAPKPNPCPSYRAGR